MRTSLAWPSWLSSRWPARSTRSASPERADDHHRATALLWLLTLACAAYWGWAVWAGHLPGAAVQSAPAAGPAPALPVLVPPAELARLLGAADNVAPGPAQRFLVWGVIADARGRGAALIGVDGQAPKPFAVGSELAPGWVLQSLGQREVRLAESAQGPVRLTLPLPPPSFATKPAVSAPGVDAAPGATATPAPEAPPPVPPAPVVAPLPPGVGPPDIPSSRFNPR